MQLMLKLSDTMNQLTSWLKAKPKTALGIGLGVLLIALVILLPALRQSKPSQQGLLPPPSYNPIYQFSRPGQNQLQAPPPSDQTSIAVYQHSASSLDLQNFFNPMAQSLNFIEPPQEMVFNSVPHLVWKKGTSTLSLNLQTGQFYIKVSASEFSDSTQVIEPDALTIAKTWLADHRLMDQDTPHQTSYYQSHEGQLEPVADPALADTYQFSFFPTLNRLPLFSTNLDNAPIAISVTSAGNIFIVDYQLPALLYSTYLTNPGELKTTTYPLKTADQVSQDIQAGLPTVTLLKTGPRAYPTTATKVTSADYQHLTLGYQAQANQGMLLPVFQLTGTAQLETGNTAEITAYLPATT